MRYGKQTFKLPISYLLESEIGTKRFEIQLRIGSDLSHLRNIVNRFHLSESNRLLNRFEKNRIESKSKVQVQILRLIALTTKVFYIMFFTCGGHGKLSWRHKHIHCHESNPCESCGPLDRTILHRISMRTTF